jgi:hypothetical protein
MATEVPRVYLHNGAGRRVGMVSTAKNVDRSYLIMEPASARFTVASDDPLLTDFDPREGRFVVIESEQYGYPWVGKLTQPSGKRSDETITIIGRSLDAVLAQRFLSGTYSGSAGAVFTAMIQDAAGQNPTGIGVSIDVSPGPAYRATINKQTAYQALNALARATAHEWGIAYGVSESEISALAYFRPALGIDRCRQASLVDGGNGQWDEWKINGEATTFAMTVVGGAESTLQAWEERPQVRRQATLALGAGSAAPLGSWHGHSIPRTDPGGSPLTRVERLQVAEALKSAGQAQNAADALLGRPYEPERAMTWVAWAQSSAGTAVDWSPFDVGSIVQAKAPGAFTAGFDGSMRILATQPVEEDGVLRMVTAIVGDHE